MNMDKNYFRDYRNFIKDFEFEYKGIKFSTKDNIYYSTVNFDLEIKNKIKNAVVQKFKSKDVDNYTELFYKLWKEVQIISSTDIFNFIKLLDKDTKKYNKKDLILLLFCYCVYTDAKYFGNNIKSKDYIISLDFNKIIKENNVNKIQKEFLSAVINNEKYNKNYKSLIKEIGGDNEQMYLLS